MADRGALVPESAETPAPPVHEVYGLNRRLSANTRQRRAVDDFSVSTRARASFIIDIVKSGSNVVATGSGSINLAGLGLQYRGVAGFMEADHSGYGDIELGLT
jgi:hypothetical protein